MIIMGCNTGDEEVTCRKSIFPERRFVRRRASVALGGSQPGNDLSYRLLAADEDAGPLEAVLCDVLRICCLGETVAVALINAERLQLGESVLSEVLMKVLADEVSHARFGWWLLESLEPDQDLKTRLSVYLKAALAHLEAHELADFSPVFAPSEAAAAAGVCDGALARTILHDTVEQVIIPRLRQHGLELKRC